MSLFNQLKDEISSVLSNFFGIKEKSMLGDVRLEIITEKAINTTVGVTNRRVEKGFNISDTTRKETTIFNLTVVDNSNDREFNRKSLYKMLEAGEEIVFYYAGKDSYENVVIESLEEIEDATRKNCFTYYVVLRQIIVAEIKATDVKTDFKKAESSGGNKKRTTAKVKTATSSEKGKVEQVKEREKSGLKNLF